MVRINLSLKKVILIVLALSCIGLAVFWPQWQNELSAAGYYPWQSNIYRLNSVVHNLDSIYIRLIDVVRPPKPKPCPMADPQGVIGRLEAMQFDVLNDRIVATMSGVPTGRFLPEGVKMELMDIQDVAKEIADMASMGFNCPYDDRRVQDALMEVHDGAMTIWDTAEFYMMPSPQ